MMNRYADPTEVNFEGCLFSYLDFFPFAQLVHMVSIECNNPIYCCEHYEVDEAYDHCCIV